MKKTKGFSLFEILITLAIISIISAFCIPIYTQHLTHERRLEAAMTLHKLALALEKYFMKKETYQHVSLPALRFPEKTLGNHYKLVIKSATQNHYILHAVPLGYQAKQDTICGTLILDSTGEKSITGSGELTHCW